MISKKIIVVLFTFSSLVISSLTIDLFVHNAKGISDDCMSDQELKVKNIKNQTLLNTTTTQNIENQTLLNTSVTQNNPEITDPSLKVEKVFNGLEFPTSMAFLGPNDILVLEKNNGTVQRIVNGEMLPKPLLDVNVANRGERGMLGIALSKDAITRHTYIFLYFTEAQTKDGDDVSKAKDPIGNRLYRYELVDNKLVHPKLLLDLPSTPGPNHNAGKITIGHDNNVYTVIGDVYGHRTKAQNIKKGEDPDGTSAIYRITQDGKIVSPTILGDKDPLNKYYVYGITQDGKIVSPTILDDKKPLNKYYAYGIRNSFGMDFDPVTGNLWDTENGPNFGDEINLVKPGFNSGWGKVQGIWEPCPSKPSEIGEVASPNPEGLVSVNGKGKYSPPEFTWNDTVGVTSLKFINSDKLGKEYENDLFVGDFHNGYLYHFDLNKKRDKLLLEGSLKDKVADNMKELKNAIFGRGFGGITDMQIGPDGYLYILSLQEGGSNCVTPYYNSWCIKYNSPIDGTIYKVVPK